MEWAKEARNKEAQELTPTRPGLDHPRDPASSGSPSNAEYRSWDQSWAPIDITVAEAVPRGMVGYIVDAVVVDERRVTLRVIEPIYNLGGNLMKIHGFRLRNGSESTGLGRLLVVAGFWEEEIRKSGIDAESLAKEIKSGVEESCGVYAKSVKVYGPIVGPAIAVAPSLGVFASSLKVGTARVILTRASTMQYIIDTLYWAFPATSRPLALQALYMIGRFIGSYLQSFADTLLGARASGLKRFREALKALVGGGWASHVEPEVEKSEKDSINLIRVTLYNYWLRPPEIVRGEEAYRDPFTAGVLEEMAESSLGGTWRAELRHYEAPLGGSGAIEGIGSKHIYYLERLA